ncbi:MAG: sorbosone dehydrogenase family protein [Candidatus Parabeggiatoa sp. nov. 1]|nr:MAG: sorbosone dehydrogenase family protein [Gammaproteobacteria bacterium]
MLIKSQPATHRLLAIFPIITVSCIGCLNQAESVPLDTITLPPGFSISLYADNVPNARSMVLGNKGTLFVSTRSAGKVYAVQDLNHDGRADKVSVLASGLNSPNGVAWRQGALFVAEINRILRFDNIESQLDSPPPPVVVNDSLPNDHHHGWKFIAFGPDDKLYLQVGAPCNVCQKDNPLYATIDRMNPDGSGLEIFAHGVRNSVGFDWHPQTGELWFTDNGRDWLGDKLPDDELNRAATQGQHFGFPYCHAGDIADPKFGHLRHCQAFEPPALKLGAHVAALGMRFYTGNLFPAAYKNQIFIAQHGSWNSSVPVGYRVMAVQLNGNKVVNYQIFAEGWLQNGRAWGRPVDVLVMPDGALLVSDDKAGVIYRIICTAQF